MTDFSQLAPTIAGWLHINPASLVLYVTLAINIARAISRRIPNDATGFWGFVRQTCAIIGFEVPAQLTSNVTVADAAASAIKVPAVADQPPVSDKLEDHA